MNESGMHRLVGTKPDDEKMAAAIKKGPTLEVGSVKRNREKAAYWL